MESIYDIASTSEMIDVAEFSARLDEFEKRVRLRVDYLKTNLYRLKPIDDYSATVIAENRYLSENGFDIENLEKLQADLTRDYYYYALKNEMDPSAGDFLFKQKKDAYDKFAELIDEFHSKEVRQGELSEKEREAFMDAYYNLKIEYLKPTLLERLRHPDIGSGYERLLEERQKLEAIVQGKMERYETRDWEMIDHRQRCIEAIEKIIKEYHQPKALKPTTIDRFLNPQKVDEYQKLEELSNKIKKLQEEKHKLLNSGRVKINAYKQEVIDADVQTQIMNKLNDELRLRGETLNTISQAKQCCQGLDQNLKLVDLGYITEQSASDQILTVYINELNNLREKSNLKSISSSVTVGELEGALEKKHLQDLRGEIEPLQKVLKEGIMYEGDDYVNLEIASLQYPELKREYDTLADLKKTLTRITDKEQLLKFKGDPTDRGVVYRHAGSVKEQSRKLLEQQEKNKSLSRKFDDRGIRD